MRVLPDMARRNRLARLGEAISHRGRCGFAEVAVPSLLVRTEGFEFLGHLLSETLTPECLRRLFHRFDEGNAAFGAQLQQPLVGFFVYLDGGTREANSTKRRQLCLWGLRIELATGYSDSTFRPRPHSRRA